ncbi:MAG: hypothetical protein KIT52_20360 [Anaerolineae bacterium]|nr:hypothetical protein [Anaerolineae bacterium]
MKSWIVTIGLLLLLTLAACSAAGDTTEPAADAAAPALSDGDLSAEAQLALGTLQLEDTDVAVDETQAATLLPLWQAYQSLANSDTTATVELSALVQQIQRAMTPAQVQAIADMKLTADSLTALQESGALAFGGPGGADGTTSNDGQTRPDFSNFQPPADGGGGGFAGGGPGGDFAGGLSAGGDFSGGNLSEDDMATRQAALANMDPAEMQSRMLTGMVIRLLQTKTGEMPAGGPGGMGGGMDAALAAVAEATGLSADDIRAQMNEGQTLADIVTANGGDIATVRAAVVAALQALPEAADMDVEAMADRLLEQAMPSGQGAPPAEQATPAAAATP